MLKEKKLFLKDKIKIGFRIQKLKFFEFIRFDSRLASLLLSLVYVFIYFFLRLINRDFRSIYFLGNLYRHGQFESGRKFATNELLKLINKHGAKNIGLKFQNISNDEKKYISKLRESIIKEQERPFDKRLLILSPPTSNKKGVLIIKYTNYFKYFFSIFNMDKIKEHYILVVEPSFAGYLDPDILCLLSSDIPIVIQAFEPRDFKFVKQLPFNFYPVDLGPNQWIDGRVFRPLKNKSKLYDIVMISIWADFKRHYHLFNALSKSKLKDRIKVLLIGNPWPKTINDIKKEAQYYKVDKNITFKENISQEQINVLLNQSKCLVLLSKKEGSNKSIIEAMYANVPAFILEGHNFGYRYPFINKNTGGFINRKKLVQFIDNIDNLLNNNNFSPSEWIRNNVSPEISTSKIKRVLLEIEDKEQLRINKDIAVKINNPDLDYKDRSKWVELRPYYKQLKNYLNQK